MNTKILLFAIAVAGITSCSTAYKTGQTPDDVYYSPVRTYGEDKKEETKQDNREVANTETSEDRRIRIGINDPRYRNWDYGYDYAYTPYKYGYNYGYYYNPYYCSYPVYYNTIKPVVVKPVSTVPRTNNLGSYANTNYNNTNNTVKLSTKMASVKQPVRNTYNNNNQTQTTTTPKVNNSSSSNDNRTYTPASSNNNGSSSSGGSSGTSVSRPARKSDK